jgi:hypothetical protein
VEPEPHSPPGDPYCDADRPSAPARPQDAGTGPVAADAPVADCVRCGEPTEHPADVGGAPLCPLCEWQQAQRGACSG